ncbi:MAG: DNA-binding protein [Calothrix sp. MO_192.B10]|nr:DNA-binding protein [Calothrix sp. MO_192.B10]
MIKNEKQYEYSKECAERFAYSISLLDKDEEMKQKDFEKWQMNRDVKKYRLEKLQAEIAEYENLTSHNHQTPIVLTLEDIYYLPQLLIKARIAAKLSQKELGALAGLTEEQIKDYEAKDYDGANFTDVMGLFLALDMKIQKGEFLVPLDTLRRTPVTKEELRSSLSKKLHRRPPF